MKQDVTEMVFILDRSGSMAGLEDDTIGGFNAMLKKQQKEPGHALVTTILFDDCFECLHDRQNIQSVSAITDKDYYVRGSTALLDAIGKTIKKINKVHKALAPEALPEKVVCVITTDGMENASNQFTVDQVQRKIKKMKEKKGWEFIFLGANIDAIAVAEKFGISSDYAAEYHADAKGTALNYQVISEAMSTIRSHKKLDQTWKDKIVSDFTSR